MKNLNFRSMGIGYLKTSSIIFISAILLITANGSVFAANSEFRCEVRVENSQVESGRSNVFDEIENRLEEYINDQKWTNIEVHINERIECNFTLTITEWEREENTFKANLQVQAVRPVFNSGYNTTLLNHLDEDLEFEFASHTRLEHIQGSYMNELSSVISFYLYFILGLDFDSYSMKGGTQFYGSARDIASSAQTGGKAGWRPFESDRNRHGLVQNILEERNENFRIAWYNYHRMGLDNMAEDPEIGRKEMLEALKTLRQLHQRRPNAYLLRLFFRAKSTEIINAYSQGSASERRETSELMQSMDPRNSQEYRRRLR